jgi:hypothetical protein
MLSVWWDAKGVVYWQLLPTNENISAKVYCEQLENLMANIKAKRPEHDKIYFLRSKTNGEKTRRVRLDSLATSTIFS